MTCSLLRNPVACRLDPSLLTFLRLFFQRHQHENLATMMMMMMMMKVLTLFVMFLSTTTAFVVVSRTQRTTVALKYTIIGAPEDDIEQDPNSVGYQRNLHRRGSNQQRATNGAAGDLSSYRDYDAVLEDEDILNVDSFNHASGASIMPGFHLSALCGDD